MKRFVKLLINGFIVDERIRPAGSVVSVHEARAAELTKPHAGGRIIAKYHPGPEFEPEPEPEAPPEEQDNLEVPPEEPSDPKPDAQGEPQPEQETQPGTRKRRAKFGPHGQRLD